MLKRWSYITGDQSDSIRHPASLGHLWKSVRGLSGTDSLLGAISIFDQAVVSGTRFLTTVVIGRLCGVHELGNYSLGFTIVLLMMALHEALISTPLTVLYCRHTGRRRRSFAAAMVAQHGILSAVVVVGIAAILLVSTWISALNDLSPILWTLLLVVPGTLLWGFARKFSYAELNPLAALRLDVLVAVTQLSCLTAVAMIGRLSATSAFLVTGGSMSIVGLFWLTTRRNWLRFDLSQVPAFAADCWKISKWVLASRLVSAIHSSSLHWLLAICLGASATGVLAACLTVAMLSNPFVLGINSYLAPRVSAAFQAEQQLGVRRVVVKSLLVIGCAMGGFSAAVAALGGAALVWLYGDSAYAQHGVTVFLLALHALFGAASMTLHNALVVIGRAGINVQIGLISLVITLAAAFPCVSMWGVAGAAIALLTGNIAGTLVQAACFFATTREVA